MEKCVVNKSILSILLLVSFMAGNVTMSPLYAMNRRVENSDTDSEDDVADFVMRKVRKFPMGGRSLACKFREHRDSCPYRDRYHLGEPVIFAEGVPFHDINGKAFNSSDNELKIIGITKVNQQDRTVAAVHEGGHVYAITTRKDGTVVQVSNGLLNPNRDREIIFAHAMILCKKKEESILTNAIGHTLVDRNGVLVMTQWGELLFTNGEGLYFDWNGEQLKLADKDVDRLPTIYKKYHPVVAVSIVLAATGAVGLAIVGIALKAVKWGHNKIFSSNQKEKQLTDDKIADNKKGEISDAAVGKDAKDAAADEQQLVQKPVGQVQPELGVNTPVNSANVEKQKEPVVQSNLQADTQSATINPERPQPVTARAITPVAVSPIRQTTYQRMPARTNWQQGKINHFGVAR